MRACITYASQYKYKYKYTNEYANCVIGIRSNNLLKSYCELRILFGNYVYSSAHPVDVGSASVRWRRSVSASFIFSFPLSIFQRRKFVGFFFCSTLFTELCCFPLIWFLTSSSPLSLSKPKFHFACAVHVRVCWKISARADCEALKWNMQM